MAAGSGRSSALAELASAVVSTYSSTGQRYSFAIIAFSQVRVIKVDGKTIRVRPARKSDRYKEGR